MYYQLIKIYSKWSKRLPSKKLNLNEPNQEQWITQIVIVLLQKYFFSFSFDKHIKLSSEIIICQLEKLVL